MLPPDIPDGATVELETTEGWTRGVVLRNHRKDRWLQLHDGHAIDDIEYEEIIAVKSCVAPALVKQPKLKHQRLSIASETSFEANQGRGWGPKK